MPLHKDLTGLNLHEPKGADTASADEVYVADGAGSGTWQTLTRDSLAATALPGCVLLETKTASNSASLNFTTDTFIGTFSKIEFVIDALQTTVTGLDILVDHSYDGGSSWVSNYYHCYNTIFTSAGAGATLTSIAAAQVYLTHASNGPTSGSGGGLNGRMEFIQYSGGRPCFTYKTVYMNGTPTMLTVDGVAINAQTNTANGIRFRASSGNLLSGAVSAYGYYA